MNILPNIQLLDEKVDVLEKILQSCGITKNQTLMNESISSITALIHGESKTLMIFGPLGYCECK